MDLFTKDELRELAQAQASPCVSLYMPTYHVESEVQQNPIRFKNLVRQTRQDLQDEGYREADIEQIMPHFERMLDQPNFWLSMSDGLAAFATPEGARFFRLPLAFDQLVVTGRRFHLKPLFPIIASNNVFYLLAISQKHVRLFQGTHYSIAEVHTEEIPKHILEVIGLDDPESDETMLHPGRRLNRAEGFAYHGHGSNTADQKHEPHDELRRFFHEIDKGIRETLKDEKAPMVLAGVDYYLPIYREANNYKYLVEDKIISGSPRRVNPQELHAKAWEIVEPMFLKSQEESIEHFRHLSGNNEDYVSEDIHDIVPAAVFSRIDTLFVPIGEHRWGRYDQENNTVELHDDHQAGDDDLLDFAAVHTYLHGGTVHALRPENMPSENGLAATFRFPAKVTAEEQH